MATFRTSILPALTAMRRIPDQLGLRLYTVQLVTTTWSGGNVGAGIPTNTYLTLSPNPKVISTDDGRKLTVGPITPDYFGGGFSFAMLRPTLIAGNGEYNYSVTGPFTSAGLSARQYDLEGIEEGAPLHYTLSLSISEYHAPAI